MIKYILSKRWEAMLVVRNYCLQLVSDIRYAVPQRIAISQSWVSQLAANGMPLIFAIIFAAKEMEESWVLGFDPTADLIGDENNDVAGNTGRGRRYPMGPSNLQLQWPPYAYLLLLLRKWKHHCGAACANDKDC